MTVSSPMTELRMRSTIFIAAAPSGAVLLRIARPSELEVGLVVLVDRVDAVDLRPVDERALGRAERRPGRGLRGRAGHGDARSERCERGEEPPAGHLPLPGVGGVGRETRRAAPRLAACGVG